MADTFDLEEVRSRSQRYWNVDGLPELMMGLVWCCSGRRLAVRAVASARSRLECLLDVHALPARLQRRRLGLGDQEAESANHIPARRLRGVECSDARPETHGRGRRRRDRLGAALITRSRTEGLERVAAPGLGVILSLAFVAASFTQRAPHLLVLAPVALLLGLAFAASTPGWDAMNWMFIALGGATALLGAVRLWMFPPASHPAGAAGVNDIDRVIHEPARLLLVALLSGVKEADFLWLQRESALTKGNLSSHLGRLEDAGYIAVQKTFKGKVPLTVVRLTREEERPPSTATRKG